jgi:succinate-semialdehyde dehydrogenase / glutarate-semialdehyde dehydrogenase
MVLQSINPTTEDVVETFEEFSDAQVDSALDQAHTAQQAWRNTSFDERSARLQSLARALRAQKGRLAALATREMGKPIVEAEAEVEKCAWNCDFYAEHAATFLADEHVEMNLTDSFVAFEPLGVVLAIMPWNFPFWQVVRFAAPALMAGNAAVLKHASNVPGCALAIEEVMRNAGLPDGIFRTVLVPGSRVDPLIADSRISAVTLTGSSDVGERVASAAGKHLKKQVLELGGSDPFVVLADADVEAAVKTAVRARNQNNGQSCIAAKRFIVEAAVADEFTERFAETVKALHVGDPMQRDTNAGSRRLARRAGDAGTAVAGRRRARRGGRYTHRRQGLLLPADRPGRRQRRHARLPRGNLWTGGRGDPRPRRGRRRSPGQ